MARKGALLRTTRSRGVLVSVSTYVAAMFTAVLAVRVSGLGHPLADLALGTLVATVVVFVVSVAADNSSVYDPYWSVQPLAIAGYYMWTEWGQIDIRQLVVTILVLLYAVRLTSNFYRGWPGLGKEDFRYVEFRKRFGKAYWPVSFFGIHLFPTILVFLGCLPLYALTREGGAPFGWLDALGTVVTLGAVVLALVADGQLRRFRSEPGNEERFMDKGLWAVSRHPNYLGEVLTWWGLWLFALGAGLRWWWTLVGAAAISVMFLSLSIPWMERRMLRTRVGYEGYRERVPVFLPVPGLLKNRLE